MKMTGFEIQIINKVREIMTPFLDKLFEIITILGEETILILLLIGIYFIVSKKEGQIIAFSVFTTLLLNNAIKISVQRIRPFEHPDWTLVPVREETATGFSFPSGHSQNAAAGYFSIANTYRKRWLWIALSVLVTLIGISRVGLGVHYPTDVLVGIALGLATAFLGRILFERTGNDFRKQALLYAVTALVFVPFFFIFFNKLVGDHAKFKDFYTGFAFYLGYVAAVLLEKKFVDFDCSRPLPIRILRTIIALVLALTIKEGLKLVLPSHMAFAMLRYFLLAFVVLGIYPLVSKKWLF
jgi:membrane-associated phospholipid phosphatase